MVVANTERRVVSLQRELMAEYSGRASAGAARELLEAHGIPHADLTLEASPAGPGRLERETLHFDYKTMRHVGGWTVAGLASGVVIGLALVGAGILVFAGLGGPIGVNAAIALLLGGTGGGEAGAFIGATASLPGLKAINADLLTNAEPHVFLRVHVPAEQDAEATLDLLASTQPEQLRRLVGTAVAA